MLLITDNLEIVVYHEPEQLELFPEPKTGIDWLCGLTITDKALAQELSPGPK